MNVAIPLATSVVSFLFALSMLDQFLERRRPYQLVWTIGLALYCLASLMQFVREAFQISEPVFRVWYFTGAMLVPAYLGMGTMYLVAWRKAAHGLMIALAVVTAVGGVLVFTLPLEHDLATLSAEEVLTGRGYIPVGLRLMTVALNVLGTLAFVGGALYSAWVFWRRRTMGYRLLSTTLIAVGGLASAAGGTLEGIGLPEPHALALLLGVIIMYIGFMRSSEVFTVYRLPFRRPAKQAPS
ncbi:MAG: hypothetical protein Q7K03_08220 [Dehalococcoidia bacterium]|nr:hypothetical protein [Dehalococcoidia bacterium]